MTGLLKSVWDLSSIKFSWLHQLSPVLRPSQRSSDHVTPQCDPNQNTEYWKIKWRFAAEFCRRIRSIFKQYVYSSWNHSTNFRSTSHCSYSELLKFVKCKGVLMLILPSQNTSFAGVDVIFRRGNSTRRVTLTCFSTFAHVHTIPSPDMRRLNSRWRNRSILPP